MEMEREHAGISADRWMKSSDYGAKTRESLHQIGKTKDQFQASICQDTKRNANQLTLGGGGGEENRVTR